MLINRIFIAIRSATQWFREPRPAGGGEKLPSHFALTNRSWAALAEQLRVYGVADEHSTEIHIAFKSSGGYAKAAELTLLACSAAYRNVTLTENFCSNLAALGFITSARRTAEDARSIALALTATC